MKRPKMSLPEAVDGFGWTHQATPNSGSVDLLNRVFCAPIEDTPEARFIRLHELAHARWTPRKSAASAAKKACVSFDALQVAEDARIQLKLHASALEKPTLCGALTKAQLLEAINKAVEFNQQQQLTLMAVACIGTQNLEHLREIARNAEREADIGRLLSSALNAAEAVARELNRRLPRKRERLTFQNTLEAARLLDSILGLAAAREDADELPPITRHDGTETADDTAAAAEPGHGIKDGHTKNRFGASESGEMTITRLPCTVATDALKLGRTRRACDVGSVPRNLHRLMTDGRVFDIKRRAAGGTVLIDASGSMHIDTQQITEMLETAPAAVVAMYSGHGDKGTLTIIAERSKIATPEAIERQRVTAGAGNIIDEPALAWLAKQAEPRLWVCDGIVTGKQDRNADAALTNRIRTIAVRGRIRRADTTAAALVALKGKAAR